jgi:hypothetical protein
VSRARPLFVALFTVAMLTGAIGGMLPACGSTATTDIITPITGVTVRAEMLTAGRGCGTGATQLFKYAVVVFARGAFAAGNLYDCFTDGTFVELPNIAPDVYMLDVVAFNNVAFVAAGGNGISAIFQRLNENHLALGVDGGDHVAEQAAIDADLQLIRALNPTYSTTCTGQQLELVQTLAVCKPLQVGAGGIQNPLTPASIVLSLASFLRADGTTLTCDDQYTTVRATIPGSDGGGITTDTRCSALGDGGIQPVSLTISPADAPATYSFPVILLRADGSTVGATTCGAETSPALTSTAVCEPLP